MKGEAKQWVNLYGDFKKTGVSLRSLQSTKAGDVSTVLESGALHLFLSLSGDSLIFGEACRLSLSAKTLSCCMIRDKKKFSATNLPSEERNELIVLCVSPDWVEKHFGSKKQSLHDSLVELLTVEGERSLTIYKVRSMSFLEYEISVSLMNPPVHTDAISFWYLAKIVELLAHHLFKSASLGVHEPFCASQKRLVQGRIDKALIWLDEHIDQPLDLSAMAKYMNCSSSYLSRVFSEKTGMTIRQKLREIRSLKAKELLESGDYNVTEAALEVGYSSLSHFTKVFKEVVGRRPSEILK